MEFIEQNCLRNIRLEELASLTGLSQSHFSHAFKASTGVAPHQWQTNARLDRAKQLLLQGKASLPAIASETGFSDQAHFTRVFRKNMGTTPAHWKKAFVA
jgi:transcriptional regulator GlxA family with amidase domain